MRYYICTSVDNFEETIADGALKSDLAKGLVSDQELELMEPRQQDRAKYLVLLNNERIGYGNRGNDPRLCFELEEKPNRMYGLMIQQVSLDSLIEIGYKPKVQDELNRAIVGTQFADLPQRSINNLQK